MLSGLAFAPLYIFLFVHLSLYYLIIKLSEHRDNYLKSFLYGISFGFGYFLVQLYWISFSLLVDIKVYFWLLPFAIMLIPLACSLFFACGCIGTTFFIRKLKIKNRFLITTIFSFCFVGFEYLRGLIFPWSIFSYTVAFSDTLSQIFSILNIYIFDFILILFFSLLFVFFDYKNKKFYFLKENKYYMIFYFLIVIFVVSYGIIRLKHAETKKFNLNIRMVQANIPQTLKWDKEEAENILDEYIKLSTKDNFDKTDVIIWSESSIPYILTKYSILSKKFDILKDKILITGAVRGEFKTGFLNKIWNSFFVFRDNKILDFYDKVILVPFGEYIPFSKYIPFIKKITAGNIDFSKGTGNKTINIGRIKISPIICYEIAFPNHIMNKKDPPDLIVNLTNDGWFGKSSGPYQHLVLAKIRAIENKTPIIRVSNSGISAYIDEYGRIIKKSQLDKVETLDLKI